METKEILNTLYQDIHSICIGTIDTDGHPLTAILDILRADESGIYVSTHKYKKIYQCLNSQPFVSIVGMAGEDYFHSKMVTFNGKVENLGGGLVDQLLSENPYLYRLFPIGRDNSDLDVFRIYGGVGEYQDFSVEPNVRITFRID